MLGPRHYVYVFLMAHVVSGSRSSRNDSGCFLHARSPVAGGVSSRQAARAMGRAQGNTAPPGTPPKTHGENG